jgi:hypothetical protein
VEGGIGSGGGTLATGRGQEVREERWGLKAFTDGRKKKRGKEGSGDVRRDPFILACGCGGRPEKGCHTTCEERGWSLSQ